MHNREFGSGGQMGQMKPGISFSSSEFVPRAEKPKQMHKFNS